MCRHPRERMPALFLYCKSFGVSWYGNILLQDCRLGYCLVTPLPMPWPPPNGAYPDDDGPESLTESRGL